MAAYQGLVTPPVFWPMLLFIDAGASGAAGLPSQGLAPIDTAIELTGGTASDGVMVPELFLLRGDLLAALEAAGADVPSGSSTSYQAALELAGRLGVRMSELRAATRLCRSATGDQRGERVGALRSLLETFTEGSGTADLVEARAALEVASGA